MGETVQKAYRWLASTEFAIALFLVICVAAIPGTFLEKREAIYHNPFFLALLVLLAANLVLCTIRRFRSVSRPVLLLHCGVLMTLAGCLMTSTGYVATVNVFEGSTTQQAYRWDLNRDVPLGMELTVRQIHREYYPVPIRVGVLKGEEKSALQTLKTGESFPLDGYRVQAVGMEFPGEVLNLDVYNGGTLIGSCDTDGNNNLPADFPYRFKLVAFRNPVYKRVWVDLGISRNGKQITGISEVNSPFAWDGLYFYNTQLAADAEGRSYAGIQIVNDPGRPFVFTGFAVVCVGAALCFVRRFSRTWT